METVGPKQARASKSLVAVEDKDVIIAQLRARVAELESDVAYVTADLNTLRKLLMTAGRALT